MLRIFLLSFLLNPCIYQRLTKLSSHPTLLNIYVEECLVKVDVPKLATYLNRTPLFELYVLCCGSKNKYLIYEEIRLHTQITITILNSIGNKIDGDLYDQNDHMNL